VQELREKHHVYILNNGRLTISGINEENIDYIASAIHDVNL
jgi:aspartate aminotransferase